MTLYQTAKVVRGASAPMWDDVFLNSHYAIDTRVLSFFFRLRQDIPNALDALCVRLVHIANPLIYGSAVRLPYRNAGCIAANSNQPFRRTLRIAQEKLSSSLHQWTGRLLQLPLDSHNLSDSFCGGRICFVPNCVRLLMRSSAVFGRNSAEEFSRISDKSCVCSAEIAALNPIL